jgi:hypothetical protein
MGDAKLARHPLAFGITYWGPLPGTSDAHVQWDGPGSGLYFYPSDPSGGTSLPLRIRHASAAGTYQTVRDAERAVRAFLAAGLAEDN